GNLGGVAYPVRKFSFGLQFKYGADLLLSDILSGSIDVRLRIKFFFFSKTWRKNLVTFRGIPEKRFELFSGGSSLGRAKWGTVQMPLPFFSLLPIPEPFFTASFDAEPLEAHAHEEFLYDSQCTCVEDYESTPVAERDKLRACARLEDCC